MPIVPEPDEKFLNRFAHLEIQDIDNETYEKLPNVTTTPNTSAKPAGPKPKFAPDELDEISEYLFALDCFMVDIHNLQEQLKEFWESYADAEVDLTTVSVTTNIAVEMVKRAEEDFLSIKIPEHMLEINGETSISTMYFTECLMRDQIHPKMDSNRKYFVPMNAWEQAQESYLHLHRFVQVYSNGTTPGRIGPNRVFAVTRPAHLGSYNPELEWDDITPERQYEQIAALVNDMLVTFGGFVILAETVNDDMLLKGISEFQMNQIPPPMWLLFAVQNFVDIHFILKTRSERPYEELRSFALSAVRTLKDHQAFLTEHPLDKMRSQEDEEAVTETLREIEEWVLEDKMKQTMNSVTQFGPTKKRRVWQDFEILRMSPVLCGMLKYGFHIQLQWKGITLVNDTGLVTAAHLYNALQQNGYLGKKNPMVWDDMEYLLDLHKVEDTFLGERPQSIEDCTKRLTLVQGVAPTTFARRRRGNNNRVLRSRAGSKFLSPSTAVAQILGNKYLGDGESDWHLSQLDTIMGLKFQKVMADMKEYNERMDAKTSHIDISTQDGKMELLAQFVPEKLDLHKIAETVTGFTVLQFQKGLVQVALDKYDTSRARWALMAQEVLDELDEAEDTAKSSEIGDSKDRPTSKSSDDGRTELTIKDIVEEKDDGASETDRPSMADIMERWRNTQTLPLELFIDILRDSLALEYLDIQFDYFAFFRSTFSLMLELQKAITPILRPRVIHNGEGSIGAKMFDLSEGAVCVVPQLSLLVACDPLEAPNIITLRPWLEVDLRPLEIAAKIMRPWIEENGDVYCVTEEEREGKRAEDVLKEGPKVKYVDDEPAEGEERKERKVGWSSSLGLIEGLNAREMREIFDAMKEDGAMDETVAEAMARLRGVELTDEDKELIRMRDEVKQGLHNLKKERSGEVDTASEGSGDSLD